MSVEEEQHLVETLVELIRTNRRVRKALLDWACSSPHLVVQY